MICKWHQTVRRVLLIPFGFSPRVRLAAAQKGKEQNVMTFPSQSQSPGQSVRKRGGGLYRDAAGKIGRIWRASALAEPVSSWWVGAAVGRVVSGSELVAEGGAIRRREDSGKRRLWAPILERHINSTTHHRTATDSVVAKPGWQVERSGNLCCMYLCPTFPYSLTHPRLEPVGSSYFLPSPPSARRPSRAKKGNITSANTSIFHISHHAKPFLRRINRPPFQSD